MPDRYPTVEPYPGRDDRGGYLVHTPYSEAFVRDLKAQLPVEDRYWVADAKAWWVGADWDDLLTHLLLEHFGEYGLVDPDTGAMDYVSTEAGRIRQGGLAL